jgi:coenzyme F420-0:L-glutamate ligase/coenzyme F420-1:gamma-L-glutamate ligase
MNKKIELIGLENFPLVKAGDNIAQIIFKNLNKNNISLKNGDILVIAQTIVSKSIGRIRDLRRIKPSKRAIEIYNRITTKGKKVHIPIKSPELVQAILDESEAILKAEHVLIVETNHGFVCANAGIDKSNIEGENNISLLPENPDEEANKIRSSLKKLTGKDLAIIISDSFGRPFRVGAIGIALGISGINPILDKKGEKDLFGYELQSTIVGQADNLASAAQLVMGEADEGLPIVIIRGYEFDLVEKTSISAILREKNLDLFREKASEEYFVDLLKSRRSYKLEFSSEDIDIKLIEECIDIARWAPSAHNGQFWRYIILEKSTLREDLIIKMNEKLRKDLLKDGKSKSFIKRKIQSTKNQFLKAPYLILLCLDKPNFEKYSDPDRNQNEFIMEVQSVSASATYLLLTLESKGLAACWYCAPLFTRHIVKDMLNLPESYYPIAFFTTGYSTKTPPIPKRKRLEDIIFNLNQ